MSLRRNKNGALRSSYIVISEIKMANRRQLGISHHLLIWPKIVHTNILLFLFTWLYVYEYNVHIDQIVHIVPLVSILKAII